MPLPCRQRKSFPWDDGRTQGSNADVAYAITAAAFFAFKIVTQKL
jgi:hypothetical protein